MPPQTQGNGFYSPPGREAHSGEDSARDALSGSIRRSLGSNFEAEKRAARAMDYDTASASSAASLPGKRRISRNYSPSSTPTVDEDGSLIKRSPTSLSTPALRSSAERRSKSRGESKGKDNTADFPVGRIKASSPGPSGHGLPSSDMQSSRVPKRTPRLSPRASSLRHAVKESEDRGGYHSWEREARRRAPISQVFSEAPSFDGEAYRRAQTLASNIAKVGDDIGPAAGVSQAVSSTQASPSSRDHGETSGYDDLEYQHAVRSSSSISGATTPTESGELMLLRLRANHSMQQAPDSRIMKLIGRRSVLCGASLYAEKAFLRSLPEAVTAEKAVSGRRDPEQQRQRSFGSSRVGPVSSPSSPPKTSARLQGPSSGSVREPSSRDLSTLQADTHEGMQASGSVPAKPLGEANRTPPGSNPDVNNNRFEVGIQSAWTSATPPGGNDDANGERLDRDGQGACTSADSKALETHSASPSGSTLLASNAAALDDTGNIIQHSVSAEVPLAASESGGLEPQATAKNLMESFSAIAPGCYPTETELDQGLLCGFENAPTFGLSASDRAATLGQMSTMLPNPADEAFLEDLRNRQEQADLGLEAQQSFLVHDSAGATLAMPAGASQVDTSLPPAAEGMIIWPGRQLASKDEVTVGEVVQSPTPTTCNAPGPSWSDLPFQNAEQMQEAMQVSGLSWPSALLQNEAGSLVVPHTWRYVPPPQQALNTSCAESPTSGMSPDNNAPTLPEEAAGPVIRRLHEEAPAEAPPVQPLDLDEKRQLLAKLVGDLLARAQKAEKALSNEQRQNRALNVTAEVLQGQVLCLQQQLEVVSQSWQYGGLSLQGFENPSEAVGAPLSQAAALAAAAGFPLVDQIGVPTTDSAPLPVEAAAGNL